MEGILAGIAKANVTRRSETAGLPGKVLVGTAGTDSLVTDGIVNTQKQSVSINKDVQAIRSDVLLIPAGTHTRQVREQSKGEEKSFSVSVDLRWWGTQETKMIV